MKAPTYAEHLRRAALPEVLFPGDIALALEVPPSDAAAAMRAGLLGPHCLIAGRPAVLREAFLRALKRRSTMGQEVLGDARR